MAVLADPTSFRSMPATRSLARRLGLVGFGHWWARELAAAMPAAIHAFLERRRARPVLAFDGSTATLWLPVDAEGRRQMRESVRIGVDGDPAVVASAGRSALAPLVAAVGSAPQIVVSLSPRAALRKTLTLPLAIEDHLRQSLAYDLDRHTPFKPDELYFDAVVVDRDPVRNTLRVELAAARRSVVDTVLRQAESFGARVARITVDPPATASSSPIDLLPDDRRLPSLRATRWQVVLPAVLLAAGVVAALVVPVLQKREETISLIRQTEEARQHAQVSDALRTQLERGVGDYNFALERKYAFPSTLQVLDDVTRILPDDTWLTQLEVHTLRSGKDVQRELTLRGESANAGRLVSLLEDSKVFTQSAPRSPTTKIQPGPGEIFDVSTHVKPLPAPPTLAIDKTTAAPSTAHVSAPPSASAAPAAPAGAPGAPPAASAANGKAAPSGAPATVPAGTPAPAATTVPAGTPAPAATTAPKATAPQPAPVPASVPPVPPAKS